MTEDVRLHLERADDCLAEAELLLSASHPGVAVSRSCYAMFHAATAALLHGGVKRRSHQGIIAAFGQTFVKPGRIDAKFHRHLKKAFDLRQESDCQRPGFPCGQVRETVVERSKRHIASLCTLQRENLGLWV